MTVADHTPPHLANIAAPADATHVGEWDDYETGRWSRNFTGTRLKPCAAISARSR